MGTIRSSVSLTHVKRFLERILFGKSENDLPNSTGEMSGFKVAPIATGSSFPSPQNPLLPLGNINIGVTEWNMIRGSSSHPIQGQNILLGKDCATHLQPPIPQIEPKKEEEVNEEHQYTQEGGETSTQPLLLLQTPSILAREQGIILRPDVLTSSDFLLPELLLLSSNNKICGFYYII